MTLDARDPWHALDADAALLRLGSTRAGLSSDEAERRLAVHGANELRQSGTVRPLVVLLRQFQSLIVLLLVAAAIVSGALGEWLDSGAILAIVVLNGAIGFHQEYGAERS